MATNGSHLRHSCSNLFANISTSQLLLWCLMPLRRQIWTLEKKKCVRKYKQVKELFSLFCIQVRFVSPAWIGSSQSWESYWRHCCYSCQGTNAYMNGTRCKGLLGRVKRSLGRLRFSLTIYVWAHWIRTTDERCISLPQSCSTWLLWKMDFAYTHILLNMRGKNSQNIPLCPVAKRKKVL